MLLALGHSVWSWQCQFQHYFSHLCFRSWLTWWFLSKEVLTTDSKHCYCYQSSNLRPQIYLRFKAHFSSNEARNKTSLNFCTLTADCNCSSGTLKFSLHTLHITHPTPICSSINEICAANHSSLAPELKQLWPPSVLHHFWFDLSVLNTESMKACPSSPMFKKK